MSTNYYAIYIASCVQLASTIVIKSTDAADALNNYVSSPAIDYAVDLLDPTEWKYYLNLSGEYHPTDTVMTITSLDTLEPIVFSKENLAVHIATAAGYAYGTRYYKQLVAQYPFQEMLILGILYPVDINEAIAAADGTILGYPPGLVEENEYHLISKLQTWINGYKARWTNQQFGISDSLYPATSLGIMYLNLLPAIITIRLSACKTNEAHSFHVHQYLASHGFLDTYINNMTLSQTLFFYRNINYIELNAGKQATFKWLVDNIMTVRGLPLAEFSMRHDLTNMPGSIYPALTFVKTPINSIVSPDQITSVGLNEMLTLEAPLARDNALYQPDDLVSIQEVMENSLSDNLMTKVLESSMVDYENDTPYTLTDILLAHWVYLSVNGNYVAYINITNPKSGDVIALSALDAFTLAWYAFCYSVGLVLDVVPPVFAKRVQRFMPIRPNGPPVGPATVADIMTVVDPNYVSQATATQALSMQPVIGNIISTEAFYTTCTQIYAAAQMQRNLCALQEHMLARGYVHGMISRIYSDNICQLAPPGTLYADWFTARTIDVSTLSASDFGTLYTNIVNQATGMALNQTSTLQELQTAMINLLSQLSSYSIQVVGQINNTNIQQANWTAVRAGDTSVYGQALDYCPDMSANPIGESTTGAAVRRDNVTNGTKMTSSVNHITSSAKFDHGVRPLNKTIGNEFLTLAPMITVGMRSASPLQKNSAGIIPVPGITQFLQLTPVQQQSVKSIYN